MSGVGEVIAIVSCIAGLIQAYDSGSRVIQTIKARRRAHGALPPSDLLEQSLEKGKVEIQDVVAEGIERFGENYGDSTVKMALLETTVEIQNKLLDRLTEARYDDGVIDFDECVDLSDKGRNDALLALRSLFQRRLDEEMSRKKLLTTQREELKRENTGQTAQPTPMEEDPLAAHEPPVPSSPATRPPTSEAKSSRRMSKLFRSRSTTGQDNNLTAPTLHSETAKSLSMSPNYKHRSLTGSIDTRIIMEEKALDRPAMNPRASTTGTLVKSSGDVVKERHYSWQPGMSRASTTVSIAPNIPALAKYGGCCKYAHHIRDKGPQGGLRLQMLGYYAQQAIYECESTKCKFRLGAIKIKKVYQMDNSVHESHGLQYRPIFLAKSHVAHPQFMPHPPYMCLVCMLLRKESEVYYGHNELFLHLMRHRERTVGGTRLEGPLLFDNTGVVADAQFDINLPDFEPAVDISASIRVEPGVEDNELQQELRKLDRHSTCSSLVSYATDEVSLDDDLYACPWS